MGDVRHVTSADGTSIGYRVDGEGPVVVLAHGAGTDSGDWLFVAATLRERYTVVSRDRRGRGESDDGPDYAMEREADDILAVVDAVGAEYLVGHSYGGLCSMLAAARTDRLTAVVLYEPPIAVRELPTAVLREAVEAGRHAEVLERFLLAVGMAEDQFEAVRGSRAWDALMAAVPLLPRELEAATAWKPPPPGSIEARSLYLIGGETSSSAYTDGLEETLQAFRDVSQARLPGQLHVAHVFDAEAFSAVLTDFWSAT